MDLESRWNQSYLENGRVTNEMQETSQEIKKLVKELISRDMEAAKNSVNVLDYEIHAFAG
jgi:predicted transcriptional regulator